MGIDLNSSNFTITDRNKQVKFTTQRRMPHILYTVSGVVLDIPKILALSPTADYVERTEETILITNQNINNSNYIIFPFFRINGGPSDTGNGVIAGGGSIILRVIRQPSTGRFLGSTVMTPIVESGQLKLVIKHNLDRREETSSKNITGDDSLNIGYRIYYGRFV